MSIIVPAGNKMVDWTKANEEMVKTASSDKEEKSSDALFEAAKSFIEAKNNAVEKKAGIIPGVPDGTGPHGMGPEEGRGMGPCGKGGKDGENEQDDQDTGVVVEPVAEEKQEAEKMESAVEKIEEGVQDLKEVVQEEKGELEDAGEEVDVVEIDIEEDKIPGEEVKNDEVIVEGENSEKTEKKETDEESVTTAGAEEEFCKFAKISAPNRKKLVQFWSKIFPKEYVALMTKE